MTITERKYENELVIIVLSIIIVTGIIAVVFFLHLDNIMIINRGPFLKSPYNKSLRVELVAEGLSSPTSMAFVGDNNNNILILEKAKGTVRLVSNGSLKDEPILKVNVDAKGERGLLGVATKIQHNSNRLSNSNGITDVFLYYTEADPLRNRIYQYQLKNGNIKLVNPKLILDLPAEPGPYHQGGKLKFGQNNKFLYAVIGDLNSPDTKLQNHKYGKEPNDTSVILKINVGNVSSHTASIATTTMGSGNMQSNKYSSYYYAYGIRNSFGLAVDPVTGSIWDTENGEHTYDELNLVKPGFNSGWRQIMGPIDRNNDKSQMDLVNFAGSKYADPAFSWKYEIGVTDIEFLNSSKLGQKYTNNIFVGDINYGNLYYFEVNDTRTGIKLNPIIASDGLSDLVADDSRESSPITFGANFGRITDIETGPDGFLYILSYDEGKLYRILPSL
jgi:glucose/arabinose dehydrogenase